MSFFVESTVPRFVESQQLMYEFVSDTKAPQVKVIADGLPLPNINCSAVPLVKDGSGVGQDVSTTLNRNNTQILYITI